MRAHVEGCEEKMALDQPVAAVTTLAEQQRVACGRNTLLLLPYSHCLFFNPRENMILPEVAIDDVPMHYGTWTVVATANVELEHTRRASGSHLDATLDPRHLLVEYSLMGNIALQSIVCWS